MDGSVRIWDLPSKSEIAKQYYKCTKENKEISVSGTCLTFSPLKVESNGAAMLVGYENGVIRVLSLIKTNLSLVETFKPHTSDITNIEYTPDNNVLVTTSLDKKIWFFFVVKETGLISGARYVPWGYIDIGKPILSLSFHKSVIILY